MGIWQVFLSSVNSMKRERRKATDAVHRLNTPPHDVFKVWDHELEPPSGESGEERLRKAIGRSRVYLGLIGSELGSKVPGDPESRSIVQWEFAQAYRGYRRWLHPCKALIVMLGPAASDMDPSQRAFRDRLWHFKRGVCLLEYSDLADLEDGVYRAVKRHQNMYTIGRIELTKRCAVIGFGVVMLGLGVAIGLMY